MSRQVKTLDTASWPLPTSALAWGGWAVAAVVVLFRTGTWAVPLALLAAVALTWPLVARNSRLPGRGPATLGVGAGTVLVAAWIVIAIVVRRDQAGGDVLWVLPSYAPTSGGSFGGAVTTGQLSTALLESLRGLAVLAVLALSLRAVDSHAWFRATRLVLGGVADGVAPLTALGQAASEQHAERTALRRHGLDLTAARLGGSPTADLWRRMCLIGHELALLAPASPAGRAAAVVPVTSLIVAGGVLLTAMNRAVASGIELAALGVAAAVAVGSLHHRVSRHTPGSSADRLTSSDVAAATAGLALVLTHLLVVRPGALSPSWGAMADVTVAGSLLLLPALLVLVRPDRPQEDR